MDDENTLTGQPLASQTIATSVLGPVFVGWMIQLIFYGWGLSLLCNYVTGAQYRADSMRIKLWLWACTIGVTLQSMISFYSLYHYGVSQQRDVDTLYAQTVVDCFATFPAGIVGALVQSFLAIRASQLFSGRLGRMIFLSISALIITGGLLGSWFFTALSFLDRTATKTPPPGLTFKLANGLWLWCSCAMDVLITATLSALLYNRILGFSKSTDSMLRAVMILALETASFTAIFALIAAVLSISFSDTSLLTNSPGAFFQPLSSFYLISFLVTLSSRERIRAKAGGYTGNDAQSPPAIIRYSTKVIRTVDEDVEDQGSRAHTPSRPGLLRELSADRKSGDRGDQSPVKSECKLRVEY